MPSLSRQSNSCSLDWRLYALNCAGCHCGSHTASRSPRRDTSTRCSARSYGPLTLTSFIEEAFTWTRLLVVKSSSAFTQGAGPLADPSRMRPLLPVTRDRRESCYSVPVRPIRPSRAAAILTFPSACIAQHSLRHKSLGVGFSAAGPNGGASLQLIPNSHRPDEGPSFYVLAASYLLGLASSVKWPCLPRAS
jgi:hypothetical protein